MWVSIDVCIVPLGVGISLTPYVSACTQIIKRSGLEFELGPNGTALEGEWEEVFACLKKCHEEVHQLGSARIYTTVKINTRTDRQQSFREKVPRVLGSL